MEEILHLMNPWWSKKWKAPGIKRKKYLDFLMSTLNNHDIISLVGLRRIGKTTILYQMIEELLKNNEKKNILYVSVDHQSLKEYSILKIVEEFRKINSLKRKEKIFLFFDEIHLKKNWSKELKSLYDFENCKIFVSGSSSLLLKHEGAYLTGRIIKKTIYPLDFNEFLIFKNIKIEKTEGYLLDRYLDNYLMKGGMPEFVLRDDINYLTQLINNIVYKDIVGVHGIKNPEIIKEILLSLARRIGQKTSFNMLSKIFGLKVDTIKNYVNFLQETFLISEAKKYSRSINEQIYSPRKFYFADIGIRNSLTGFRDIGSLVENVVFIELSKIFDNISYIKNKFEIDFCVRQLEKTIPIEVKYKADKNKLDDIYKRIKNGYLISKNATKGKNINLLDFLIGNKKIE